VTGGTPNINIFQTIFEEHKKTVKFIIRMILKNILIKFSDILKIQSADDLFQVFDSNRVLLLFLIFFYILIAKTEWRIK